MPSFLSGLAGAAAKGLGGYVQGQEIGSRDLINEIARRQAARRADEDAQLRRDEFEHRKEMDAAELTTKGYHPASTTITTDTTDDEAPAPVAAPSFKELLAAGLGGTAGPLTGPVTAPTVTVGEGSATPSDGSPTDGPPADVSLMKPITDGALGRLPKLKITETPASMDPLATVPGALEAAREAARAEENAKNRTSLETRAKAANDTRVLVAKLHAANGSGRSNRAMTANAKETNARQAAKALINIYGSPDATKEWLSSNDPDAVTARAEGVTPFHVDVAAGLQREGDTKAAIGMSKSMKPARAVDRVRSTRAAADSAAGPQGPSGQPLPPLSKAERDRALADPLYRQFKESKGYRF